jgi:hypothetical protein
MNPVWQAPAVLAVLVVWLATPPTGLADVARREALRRALVGPSVGSFSTSELPLAPPRAAVSGLPAAWPPAAPPATATPPGEPARDEAWWRSRMASARATLERNEVLADAVQSRINALQTDVVNIDDPAQQALARQNLGKALGELERLQKLIEEGRKDIVQIQDEARRQRVPPGWIR